MTRHRSSSPSLLSSVIVSTRLMLPYHNTQPARWCAGGPSRASGVCAVLPGVGGPRGLWALLEPLPGQTCGVCGEEVTICKPDGDALLPSIREVRRDNAPHASCTSLYPPYAA